MTNNQKVHEAMGLCWHESMQKWFDNKDYPIPECLGCGGQYPHHRPDYENSISDAWKIVAWMEKEGYKLILCNGMPDNEVMVFFAPPSEEFDPFNCKGFFTNSMPVNLPQNVYEVSIKDTAPKAIVAAFIKTMEGTP